jgi:enolase
MPQIQELTALEILDSRGRPTVAAECRFTDGTVARASVPAGASTGGAEAVELRDRDKKRYGGLGCTKAVAHVNHDINKALSGREFSDQRDLDGALLRLDGTPNKSRLGANALLAVSIAFARATAVARNVPLYRHFADLAGVEPRLPRLTVNLFSGGKHAGGQVEIQDVLLVPVGATSIDQSLSMVYAAYQGAVAVTSKKYGARPLVADEGGLGPPFPDVEAMLTDAVDAISAAGLVPGKDMSLAIDVAASHFYKDGHYRLGNELLSPKQMIVRIAQWTSQYPIISVEDGLAEEDWDYWPTLRGALAGRVITMGDDLLCTNPARIQKAVDSRSADALLLKVNQIGTLSEAADALRLARSANWTVTVSARSGETEDDWLADLATGWRGDYIKVGSITRSERLAKYNRLLAIERSGMTF